MSAPDHTPRVDDPLAIPEPAELRVALDARSYPIRIGIGQPEAWPRFIRDALAQVAPSRSVQHALAITDANVKAHAQQFVEALETAGVSTRLEIVPPGEASKSPAQALALIDALVEERADRTWPILAIGGGVIGDLAGFVAAIYARGLPLVMVPTTLLAQVDSSVGGKVAVNHPQAKNLIGAFHQPSAVWIDVETLKTLPTREYRSGLAEVLKYGVILDQAFFAHLEAHADALRLADLGPLVPVIRRCCRLKADVVEQDEREETGLRAILNFGHTIAHAIEAVAGYGTYLHGEAVAVGMIAEARLAVELGLLNREALDRLIRLVVAFELPTTAPGLDHEALRAAMARDKKNLGGTLRFVLPDRIGHVALTPVEPDRLGPILRSLDEPAA